MFSNLNIKKTNHRVHNILLILILLLMLTTNLASAAGEDVKSRYFLFEPPHHVAPPR